MNIEKLIHTMTDIVGEKNNIRIRAEVKERAFYAQRGDVENVRRI